MIDGIANEMNKRVVKPLDDRLVDLGFLAKGDQFDLLAVIPRGRGSGGETG
jgi:hypothetical protein